MAKRYHHYEAACEAFLRQQGIPYVAVDETKRSLLGQQSLKNLDFIISAPAGSLLVDVKGRRFPTAGEYWKNWTTEEDLAALAQWQALFGKPATGLIVFAYWLVGEKSPLPPSELFPYRERWYGFIAVESQRYRQHAKAISAKWSTVSVPKPQFQQIARPLRDFLRSANPVPPEDTPGPRFSTQPELRKSLDRHRSP